MGRAEKCIHRESMRRGGHKSGWKTEPSMRTHTQTHTRVYICIHAPRLCNRACTECAAEPPLHFSSTSSLNYLQSNYISWKCGIFLLPRGEAGKRSKRESFNVQIFSLQFLTFNLFAITFTGPYTPCREKKNMLNEISYNFQYN